MTGDVETTDDFYVIFQGKSVGTATHPAGNALQATSGTFSGGITATTGSFTGDVSTTCDFKPTGKEYFHVDLTTTMTGMADKSINTVDFGGKGTVKYDTKSNFDSANDAYLLGSSDGVYLINFSIGIRSDDMSAEDIIDAIAAVFVATDGSTFVPLNGAGARTYDTPMKEKGQLCFLVHLFISQLQQLQK